MACENIVLVFYFYKNICEVERFGRVGAGRGAERRSEYLNIEYLHKTVLTLQ